MTEKKKAKKKRKIRNPITTVFRFLGEDTSVQKKYTDTDSAIEDSVTSSLGFMKWVQNFTKRIIIAVFGIFICIDLVTLVVAIINCFNIGDSSAVNSLITETNTTFRDIVGGYLVKSACENVSMGIDKLITYYIDKKSTIFHHSIDAPPFEPKEPADAGTVESNTNDITSTGDTNSNNVVNETNENGDTTTSTNAKG